MDGFLLLAGHLLGDFIAQEDWQATHKTAPWPGLNPSELYLRRRERQEFTPGWDAAAESAKATEDYVNWCEALGQWHLGNLACTVHAAIYTMAIALASFWWMPWWGYLVIFTTHWVIDRYRLAWHWMTRVANQKLFATGPLKPWSVIVVDQVLHVLILALVAALAYPRRANPYIYESVAMGYKGHWKDAAQFVRTSYMVPFDPDHLIGILTALAQAAFDRSCEEAGLVPRVGSRAEMDRLGIGHTRVLDAGRIHIPTHRCGAETLLGTVDQQARQVAAGCREFVRQSQTARVLPPVLTIEFEVGHVAVLVEAEVYVPDT